MTTRKNDRPVYRPVATDNQHPRSQVYRVNRGYRTYGIFFPFWCICFYGATWLVTTLAVTLLLDGALLVAVLLLFKVAGHGAEGAVGNIWRRKIIPFYLCDLVGSFAGGGLLLLCKRLMPRIFGADVQYYLKTLSERPFSDLRTMLPLLISVMLSGVIIYLSARYIVFGKEDNGKGIALAMTFLSMPYSLLIPNLFGK